MLTLQSPHSTLLQLTPIALTVREALGQCDEICLEVITDNPLPARTLLGKTASVCVTWQEKQRYWHGVLHTIELSRIEGRLYHYRLILAPYYAALKRESHNRNFTRSHVLDVIQRVLKPYPKVQLNPEALRRYNPTIAHLSQYQQSDFDFLQILFSRFGFTYYFTHSQQQHVLHLVNQTYLGKHLQEAPMVIESTLTQDKQHRMKGTTQTLEQSVGDCYPNKEAGSPWQINTVYHQCKDDYSNTFEAITKPNSTKVPATIHYLRPLCQSGRVEHAPKLEWQSSTPPVISTQPFAGVKRGLAFHYKEKCQLLMNFIDNDVEQPVCLGALIHPSQRLVYSLQKQRHLSGIALDGQSLIFDSAASTAKIALKTSGDYHLNVKESHRLTAHGSLSFQISGKARLQVRESLVLQAKTKLTLACGNAFIDVAPTKITLSSNIITVN